MTPATLLDSALYLAAYLAVCMSAGSFIGIRIAQAAGRRGVSPT